MRAAMNVIRAVTFTMGTGLLAQLPANAATILATPQATILAYESALNSGDAAGATSLFTADAVLLQAGNPRVVGSAEILAFFDGLFANLDLELSFDIKEVTTSGELTLVRSESAGTIDVGGGPMPAAFRELFTLQPDADQSFLISQYAFGPAPAVTDVPEPATWLLVLTGAGMVRCVMRHRASVAT